MSNKCSNCEIYKNRIENAWTKIAGLEARNEKLERIRDAAENLRDAPPIGTEGWIEACDALSEALAALEDKDTPDA